MKFPQGSNPTNDAAATDRDLPRRRGTGSRIELRVLRLERARELSRRLRLPVTIDESGWIEDEIEISIQRQRDRTISPARMLIGPDTKHLMLLDAVHGILQRYNQVIGRLRRLATQAAVVARDAKVAPGSPMASTHAELQQLEASIECRQCATMGHGTVRLTILEREIEFFEAFEARHAAVIGKYARMSSVRHPGSGR